MSPRCARLVTTIVVLLLGMMRAADQCEPGRWSFKVSKGSPCPPGHTLCGAPSTRPWQSECVLDGDLCDGVPDCACGWDEQRNCTACHNGAVLCREEAKCVRAEWRCDGTRDCADGEDEAGCPADGSTTHRGEAYDADMKYACGPVDNVTRWAFTVCDGVPDCPDASDEGLDELSSCTARLKKRTRYRVAPDPCAQGSVRCRWASSPHLSYACLPSKKVCDGWQDCVDSNRDEPRGCNRAVTRTSSPRSSPTTQSRRTAPPTVEPDTTTAAWTPRSAEEAKDPPGLHDVKVALVFLCVVCSAALVFAVAATLFCWRRRAPFPAVI